MEELQYWGKTGKVEGVPAPQLTEEQVRSNAVGGWVVAVTLLLSPCSLLTTVSTRHVPQKSEIQVSARREAQERLKPPEPAGEDAAAKASAGQRPPDGDVAEGLSALKVGGGGGGGGGDDGVGDAGGGDGLAGDVLSSEEEDAGEGAGEDDDEEEDLATPREAQEAAGGGGGEPAEETPAPAMPAGPEAEATEPREAVEPAVATGVATVPGGTAAVAEGDGVAAVPVETAEEMRTRSWNALWAETRQWSAYALRHQLTAMGEEAGEEVEKDALVGMYWNALCKVGGLLDTRSCFVVA